MTLIASSKTNFAIPPQQQYSERGAGQNILDERISAMQATTEAFFSIANLGDINAVYRNRPAWAQANAMDIYRAVDNIIVNVPSARQAVLYFIGNLVHENVHFYFLDRENVMKESHGGVFGGGGISTKTIDYKNLDLALRLIFSRLSELVHEFEMLIRNSGFGAIGSGVNPLFIRSIACPALSIGSSFLPELLSWLFQLCADLARQNANRPAVMKASYTTSAPSIVGRGGPSPPSSVLLGCFTQVPCVARVISLLDQCFNALLPSTNNSLFMSHQRSHRQHFATFPSNSPLDEVSGASSTGQQPSSINPVTALLDESKQNGTHLDWVRLHIADTFPSQIVDHVMRIGVDEFREHCAEMAGPDLNNKESSLIRMRGMTAMRAIQLQDVFNQRFLSFCDLFTYLAQQKCPYLGSSIYSVLKQFRLTGENVYDALFLAKVSINSPEIVFCFLDDLLPLVDEIFIQRILDLAMTRSTRSSTSESPETIAAKMVPETSISRTSPTSSAAVANAARQAISPLGNFHAFIHRFIQRAGLNTLVLVVEQLVPVMIASGAQPSLAGINMGYADCIGSVGAGPLATSATTSGFGAVGGSSIAIAT